jgi:hypothetical protein
MALNVIPVFRNAQPLLEVAANASLASTLKGSLHIAFASTFRGRMRRICCFYTEDVGAAPSGWGGASLRAGRRVRRSSKRRIAT